jgi:hypothetical protein
MFMLVSVAELRVWDRGRFISIVAVDGDDLIYKTSITRTAPRVKQVDSDDKSEIARLESEGWEYVSSQRKYQPSEHSKGLIPMDICQYQRGLRLESETQYFLRDMQLGFDAEIQECPDLTGCPQLSYKQLIQLQCLIQGISVKQLKQMGITYGFDVSGLIRTHIGGYRYGGLTIEDWLKSKSRPEIASPSTEKKPVKIRLGLNRNGGK